MLITKNRLDKANLKLHVNKNLQIILIKLYNLLNKRTDVRTCIRKCGHKNRYSLETHDTGVEVLFKISYKDEKILEPPDFLRF